jgi:hypothetical protein
MLGNFFSDKPALIDGSNIPSSKEYHRTVLSGDFIGTSIVNAGTQKANGILFLQRKKKSIQAVFPQWNVPKHLLFKAGTKFEDGSFNFPVFARPCPIKPRHGFVDSIVCKSFEELNNLSLLTVEEESKAEMLVTKPVDSYYNVILNGGVLTFAKGNDGATGGKGCNYFYISEDPLSELLQLDNTNLVADGEVPFYEFVLGKEYPLVNLVQVRSAPKTPRVKDYVPSPVLVKNIIKAEGDLLQWESLLKTVDPATTIIDHTNGSLSSHYAIHAIVNRIPIFTTYLPELGSQVEPTVQDDGITEEDKEVFYKSFVAGFSSAAKLITEAKYATNGGSPNHLMGNIIRLALATLHNYSAIAMSKDYEVLGIVLGMFCRVTFAVSMGETRYNKKNGEKDARFVSYFKKLSSDSRTGCYHFNYQESTPNILGMITTAYHIFDKLPWKTTFGGKKWASCTKSSINLFNACVNKEITLVVELFNRVINEEHNGGRYLNKVIEVSDFDQAAHTPSTYTLDNLHIIVDLLSTAWGYAKNDFDFEKESQGFKELSFELVTTKDNSIPTEDRKLSKFALPKAVDGKFSKIKVWDPVSTDWKICDLPESIPSESEDCQCETCFPSQQHSLYDVPFWIVTLDGTKIISKSKLSKLMESQGIIYPKTKFS